MCYFDRCFVHTFLLSSHREDKLRTFLNPNFVSSSQADSYLAGHSGLSGRDLRDGGGARAGTQRVSTETQHRHVPDPPGGTRGGGATENETSELRRDDDLERRAAVWRHPGHELCEDDGNIQRWEFSGGIFGSLTFYCPLWCSVDPRHLHERLFNPAAQSDGSTAVGITGSQQEDLSGHGGSEQRANEEGAHHSIHSGVQGLPHGGKGNDFTSCRGQGCF